MPWSQAYCDLEPVIGTCTSEVQIFSKIFLKTYFFSRVLEPRSFSFSFSFYGNRLHKTRVLLCKRLSERCKDVYMVVYFHLHSWWWAVVDCTVLHWAVLGCAGLYWSVLVCTRLNWAVVGCSRLYCGVLGCTGRIQQLFVCVFSHFRLGDNQPTRWS